MVALEVKDPVLYKLVNDLDDAERDGLKSLLKDTTRTKATDWWNA